MPCALMRMRADGCAGVRAVCDRAISRRARSFAPCWPVPLGHGAHYHRRHHHCRFRYHHYYRFHIVIFILIIIIEKRATVEPGGEQAAEALGPGIRVLEREDLEALRVCVCVCERE